MNRSEPRFSHGGSSEPQPHLVDSGHDLEAALIALSPFQFSPFSPWVAQPWGAPGDVPVSLWLWRAACPACPAMQQMLPKNGLRHLRTRETGLDGSQDPTQTGMGRARKGFLQVLVLCRGQRWRNGIFFSWEQLTSHLPEPQFHLLGGWGLQRSPQCRAPWCFWVRRAREGLKD